MKLFVPGFLYELTEKAMAHNSNTLAWKIPWTEEPGRLQSMGSLESDTTEWLHFHFHFHALEKEMATHSSVLAWRIPGTGKPGGLPSMGSHRVGHNWSDLAKIFPLIFAIFDSESHDHLPTTKVRHFESITLEPPWGLFCLYPQNCGSAVKNLPAMQET